MSLSNSASGEGSASSSGQNPTATPPPPAGGTKKKRNLPGMPDPNAEVVALSPKTLMATNRFVCEICSKGFQRDQNLQLHRRGHSLPWKLRQRTATEVRKRVYVCPVVSCVHHDPSRALGDLTGIKKHFFRKHGEKKLKCEKCSKKYAVQSDWKAHAKICSTREYRCDCGTLFSRRDSFITHRAFCNALAQESSAKGEPKAAAADSGVIDERQKKPMSPPADVVVSTHPIQQLPHSVEGEETNQQQEEVERTMNPTRVPSHMQVSQPSPGTGSNNLNHANPSTSTSLLANLFTSASSPSTANQTTTFTNLIGSMPRTAPTREATTLLSPRSHVQPTPHMSATALLQKAAQVGATSTTGSLLRGLGLATSTSVSLSQHRQVEQESMKLSPALGLGLSYENDGGDLPEMTMGSSSVFGQRSTTLDFLGLGMRPAAATGNGSSAVMIDMGGSAQFGGGKSKGNA